MVFVDYTKAFDKVKHSFLFEEMRKQGYNKEIIDVIKKKCTNKQKQW